MQPSCLLATPNASRADKAAIEALRTKAALPIDQIESLARKIAGLKAIPDVLADALEMPLDPPRARAADRLESSLKICANAARKRSF